ncbi:dnaJ [Gossypium arboreum]|uniref:DnaJ n=1 Tax=Gossypium arboreum TaxID=29729 RepID=A0A0B0NTI6_GOSAR|nr:dnaJ [Gossypium arboreum]
MNITKFCIGPLYPMEATPYPKSATFSQMALLLMGLSQGHWEMLGDNPRCSACQAKGVVLCTTSAGSGLYVDSILESQGIIVKVRCLGCGGTGNVMCSECGGRGHRGPK